MPPEAETITIRVHRSAKERLLAEAAMHGISLSEWIRTKLGVTPQELIRDPDTDERMDDFEKRLSRLEELAGL